MIAEDFVSFETAKLLKEKGFNEFCRVCYIPAYTHNGKTISFDEECDLRDEGKEDEIEIVEGGEIWQTWNRNGLNQDSIYSAPTPAAVMKWLREKHKVHMEIRITNHSLSAMVNVPRYYWVCFDAEEVKWLDESTAHDSTSFKTYEEACEDGIRKCLEKLK